jgi:hypothetical protein
MKEQIQKCKQDLNKFSEVIEQETKVIDSEYLKITKRIVSQIKLSIQGFQDDRFHINITTNPNGFHEGLNFLVTLQELGTYNVIEIFSISYSKYHGLDFTWKLLTGSNQTEKNHVHLDIIKFLGQSKFFSHMLDKIYSEFNTLINKKEEFQEKQSKFYSLRSAYHDELVMELYDHLIQGGGFEFDAPCILKGTKITEMITKLQFIKTPNRRSGTLNVTTEKNGVIPYEKFTMSQLENLCYYIIRNEIYE